LIPVITLTTDFGERDYYVGAVKGVLLSIRPGLTIVDVSHAIPPGDVLSGAFVLRNAAVEFPPGSIHLAVVDPGVGSSRRAIAVSSGGSLWVGPDNGLLSFPLEDPRAVTREITAATLLDRKLSATFHGRDLFAPCAARLAAGFPFARVGPRISGAEILSETQPAVESGRVAGQVIHVDHFGNAITNIAGEDLDRLAGTEGSRGSVKVLAGSRRLPVAATYADVERGAPVAVVGSCGLLELAVNGGNGSEFLQLQRRDPVVVERERP
jgi:S-adenosylmethionine hydrolase